MINLFQPALGQEELDAISEVFRSNWIGQGPKVREFESNFAASLEEKADYFLSTTSCTEAIFLAADIFEFSSNDEVIVPSISFPSVGSAVLKSGAKMVLCDVEPRSLNVRAEDIEKAITPYTKAVFITHYGGVPCDMDPIVNLCNEYNIYLIEDTACAVRSFYKGKACGTFGDMGMWSFDAMKTITTGDGGMVFLKSSKHMTKAKELLYLGLPVKQKSGIDSSAGGARNWWEFEINQYGRRATMNDITASIGVCQLRKLPSFLARRREIYDRYCDSLSHCKFLELPPKLADHSTSSYYFFWVQTKCRDRLAQHLLENDVYSTFRYWPLHKVESFKDSANTTLENTNFIASHTLNIPIHHSLTNENVDYIIEKILCFEFL